MRNNPEVLNPHIVCGQYGEAGIPEMSVKESVKESS
jgi:hypothetical protein